jgi:hypothetical protein
MSQSFAVTLLVSIKEHFPLCISLLFAVSLIVRTIYRLYLDPLHHIPGPKLAAITHLYEFYHDAIRDGMFVWEIEKMHQEYGIYQAAADESLA